MKIIKSYESKKRINGKVQIYVKVIAFLDGEYYTGNWKDRKTLPGELCQLEDSKIIKTRDRSLWPRPHWTMVVAPLPKNHYWLKAPEIEDYQDNNLEARMEHEIEMCEIVKRNPHPNLAVYCGCLGMEGRVAGLYFKKYKMTLLERVNPQRLSKRHFITGDRSLVQSNMRAWVKSLRTALDYLHSLDLVHNDITPANIMLDEDDVPVIIDFGGLCHVGASLHQTKRTMGWHDENATNATKVNDLDALAELETWLFGSVQDLKFAG